MLRGGATWRDVQAKYRVDPATLAKRAEGLGLEVPRGRRRTIKPMRLKLPVDPAVLGYLAGIIDGEGSIVMRLTGGPRAYAWVMVTNTNAELGDFLVGIGGSLRYRSRRGSLGAKPCWNWSVQARLDCLALLRAIEPYLRIKREKAREAIAVLESWAG